MAPTQPPPVTSETLRALSPDAALRARGEQLWARGAVEAPVRRGAQLVAAVRGSEPDPYQVTVEPLPPPREGWQSHCTCPYHEIYGGPCKHAIALLRGWGEDPEQFVEEASLDERLAGPDRERWLELTVETLRQTPELERLLALPPEPRAPSNRPVPLAPHEAQIAFARERHADDPRMQRRLLLGILETAAGYLRVGDGANAVRLATLLVDALLTWPGRRAPLTRLLFDALLLLEAAALEADWSRESREAWLAVVRGWWPPDDPAIAERLLDLLIRGARRSDLPDLVRWLRGLLRAPVQSNRLSSASWRRRLLDFLLAWYEAQGMLAPFLELCWEEGEDARAARLLVERGSPDEALVLARQGLGSSGAHRELAAALVAAGLEEEAATVADEGLRYHDAGRGALLGWLAAREIAADRPARARGLAAEAWREAPSPERLALLRAAYAGSPSRWAELRDAIDGALERRGDQALRVELWLGEGDVERAVALLPSTGVRREALTEMIAREIAVDAPARAISLLVELAELRAEGRTRADYRRAAHALLAARTVADASGEQAHLERDLDAFWDRHRRLPALRDEVERAGLLQEA